MTTSRFWMLVLGCATMVFDRPSAYRHSMQGAMGKDGSIQSINATHSDTNDATEELKELKTTVDALSDRNDAVLQELEQEDIKLKDLSNQEEEGELDVESDTGNKGTPLSIFSFNLEGRGGNQAYDDGKARRAALQVFFDSLCTAPDFRPDVIFTQEDMDAPMNGCYTPMVQCESEKYWWEGKEKYGDGKFFLNRIYIRNDLVANAGNARTIPLTEAEWEGGGPDAGGMNPRCAVLLDLTVGGTTVTLATFHLSGGYVDDRAGSAFIMGGNPPAWVTSLREIQLAKIVGQAKRAVNRMGRNGKLETPKMIMGGDTNGFPPNEVELCQGGRIRGMAKGDATIEAGLRAYLTTPLKIGKVKRLQALDGDGVTVEGAAEDEPPCGPNMKGHHRKSTSIWGGKVDAFFTNIKGSRDQILPVALAHHADPNNPTGPQPFVRALSDHNPLYFVTEV